MKSRTAALVGIYLKRVLPWFLVLLLPMFVFLGAYPCGLDIDDSVPAGVGNTIVAAETMEHSTSYTFLMEVVVLFFLCYFLYRKMAGEQDNVCLGSLPVTHRQQYLCMAGVVAGILVLMLFSEQILQQIFWRTLPRYNEYISAKDYEGWTANVAIRFCLLLFLAMFFLWLFNQLMCTEWWGSLVILGGGLAFLLMLLRLSSVASWLFGGGKNLLFYRFYNIWLCLTDLYPKTQNPAKGNSSVLAAVNHHYFSKATVQLYSGRGQLCILCCAILLALSLLFLYLGKRAFCRYGYLGRQKKKEPRRAAHVVVFSMLWFAVLLGVTGSMDMTAHVQFTPAGKYMGYYYEKDPLLLARLGGGDVTKDRKAIFDKVECHVTDFDEKTVVSGEVSVYTLDGLFYCILHTQGTAWAKRSFFCWLLLGMVFGLLVGVFIQRKAL